MQHNQIQPVIYLTPLKLSLPAGNRLYVFHH
nr:MAG TPA: hypothetical protein [Caudoviricetes sp.]